MAAMQLYVAHIAEVEPDAELQFYLSPMASGVRRSA